MKLTKKEHGRQTFRRVNLDCVHSEDVETLQSVQSVYWSRGYSVDDTVALMNLSEEVNPDLDEDEACQAICRIFDKYQS